MKTFEIGKTYSMSSPCDQNCIWTYTVTARTAQTITITDGKPDVNIKTGKITYKVRETTLEEQRKIGWDYWCASHIDIHTMNERLVLKEIEI